jgi:hypothetical protein
MLFPSTTFTSKDNPMQIDQTQLKPLMEQNKQWQCVNKSCMYYGKPSHIATNYPKKQLLYITWTTSIHTPPAPQNLGNEDVQS